jgi:hypothetical protein
MLVRNVSMQAQIIGSNTVSALLFDYPESAEDAPSALRDDKGKTPRLRPTTIPQTESLQGGTAGPKDFHRFQPCEPGFRFLWRRLAACPIEGVTAHGGPSGPLQFDRLGSHP